MSYGELGCEKMFGDVVHKHKKKLEVMKRSEQSFLIFF